MDKLQMAMRFAEIMLIEHFKGNGAYNSYGYKDGICEDAWVMADAMQAEADKRAEQKRKEIREILNADNTFIEKEGQHFDDVEWQPDWSQAPSDALTWAINGKGDATWALYENGEFYSCVEAPSFNYQGNWQDSLRKRPQ